jgi:hypothetical protein
MCYRGGVSRRRRHTRTRAIIESQGLPKGVTGFGISHSHGLLTDPSHPQSLVETLEILATDQSLTKLLGQNAASAKLP